MVVRLRLAAALFLLGFVLAACLSIPQTFPCGKDGTCPTAGSVNGQTYTCVADTCRPSCSLAKDAKSDCASSETCSAVVRTTPLNAVIGCYAWFQSGTVQIYEDGTVRYPYEGEHGTWADNGDGTYTIKFVGGVVDVLTLTDLGLTGLNSQGVQVTAKLTECEDGTDGRTAQTGYCLATCVTGVPCNGTCADLKTDTANCGACAFACPTGGSCDAGECECPTSQTACGGACVDQQTDVANCGRCGKACPAGASCTKGSCQCPAGGEECKGACVAIETDVDNCGACGVTCAPGASCSHGSCACAKGACTCPTSQTLCDGACVDQKSDVANCGACGVACAASGETCKAGKCTCGTSQTLCGDTCVNTEKDSANCGACGKACPSAADCVAGACVCPAGESASGALCCRTGYGTCNGVCVNLQSTENCGSCGNECATCQNGRCPITLAQTDENAYALDGVAAQQYALLAINNTSVFWAAGNRNFMSVPKAGGLPTTLAATFQFRSDFVATTSALYWAGAAIDSCALPTCVGGAKSLAPLTSAVIGPALSGTNLYWLGPDTGCSGATCGRAMQVPITGGVPNTLATVAGIYTAQFGGPAANAKYVFWATGYQIDRSTTTASALAATVFFVGAVSPQNKPTGYLAVDSANVYFTTSNGDVNSCPVGGCPAAGPTKLASRAAAARLAVDDTSVYFIAGLTLCKVPIAGGPVEVLASTMNGSDLAVDADSVYYWGYVDSQMSLIRLTPK